MLRKRKTKIVTDKELDSVEPLEGAVIHKVIDDSSLCDRLDKRQKTLAKKRSGFLSLFS